MVIVALKKKKTWPWAVGFVALVAAVAWLNEVLTIDYGFWGCMLPVWVAAIPGAHCVGLISGLIFLNVDVGGLQWYSLLAVLPLLCYSGTVGKRKMKYFFYIFYPAHLLALEGLYVLVDLIK